MNRFTIKKKSFLIICSLFGLLCWSSLIPLIRCREAPSSSAPLFNWQETSFHYVLSRTFLGDTVSTNYSGSYSDAFTTSNTEYNWSGGYYIKEVRDIEYQANYSMEVTTTIRGYLNLDMLLDVFRVDLQYEDAVRLFWLALKQGSLSMETFYEEYTKNMTYYEEYFQDVNVQYTKYNNTGSILDAWSDAYNETGAYNTTKPHGGISGGTLYDAWDVDFVMPMILTMQLFTTKNKDKVGWAEFISDFMIFKDRDKDGIYSAGKKEGESVSDLNVYYGDEFCGVFRPHAWDYYRYTQYTNVSGDTPSYNYTIWLGTPNDTLVSEIADSVEFTPPVLNPNGLVSWDVLYPNFPIYVSMKDIDLHPSQWYHNSENMSINDLSPGDFRYAYDYNASESEANLDFTLELPKIQDPEFYQATQGYGLCLPHYNFFISSFDVNEIDQKDLTVPSNLFTFEANGTTVAQINMMNPIKKNYLLCDYPTLGMNSEFESYGGSLSQLLIASQEETSFTGNPFINMIFSISEFAALDSSFTIVDDLFRLETQNYPAWNGEKLVHDPTFTIYYEPQVTPEEPPNGPPEGPPAIPGYHFYLILGMLGAMSLLLASKIKYKGKIPT